jgi:hypothetical protein
MKALAQTVDDRQGWPAGRFLAALAEHEIAERSRRRLERHLAEARLPPGKTLDSFDFEAVPVISKAQVMALAAGDAWLNNGANLLLFGPPGGGKSHDPRAPEKVLREVERRLGLADRLAACLNASNPPSEDSRPPSKRATTALP